MSPNPRTVVTEEQLKGWMAKWLLSYLFAAVGGAVAVIVWATNLGGEVRQNTARIEQVRVEGTVPVQRLRQDMDSLRFEIRLLRQELQDKGRRR